MKEFEKMLKAEDERKLNLKAKKLVKLGLFSQETVSEVDFSELNEITVGKDFKSKYKLYESSTGELFYIYGVSEIDHESNQPIVPFEYDVISLENLTEEEYNEIIAINKRTLNLSLVIGYWGQLVALFINTVVFFIAFITSLVGGSNFIEALISNIMLLMFVGIELTVACILKIMYLQFMKK